MTTTNTSNVGGRADETDYDIEFFWDPVCPFAWMTSRWVRLVAEQSNFRVDWRFISLRILNKDRDYSEFPDGYEFVHTAGLRMLRVASAIRAELGRDVLDRLVSAYGESYWNQPQGSDIATRLSTPDHATAVLEAAGLPTRFVSALDDASWDAELGAETELALSRTGRDVGTPIITYHRRGQRTSSSFFGPVISQVPPAADAVRLWDAVTTLAEFPSFAELKRSLRDRIQLPLFGGTLAS